MRSRNYFLDPRCRVDVAYLLLLLLALEKHEC